jgi:hypothetical protein
MSRKIIDLAMLTLALEVFIKLQRRDIHCIAYESKHGCHALHDQAASIADHVEFHITADKRQMERPDNGSHPKRNKE